ncbi:hypothetical protein ACP6L2_01875 [Sphingobacterium lactis]|uniref:hypothetical protein n=1 Tax=Sphingobacterium lactis TaxID=797291 RepID=UPI003F7D2E8A
MNIKSILFLCIFAIVGCSPDDFNFAQMEYQVDKVVCQANANYFTTDGVSQLGLQVKLYTKSGTYKDVNGQIQNQYSEIPKSRWRQHNIKFFDRSGKEYPSNYTTTEFTTSTLDFYAEVDGIRSSKPILQELAEHPLTGNAIPEDPNPVYFRMNIRQPYPTPALKKIPIVFHIVDLESVRDRSQELNSDAIYYVIQMFNNVFGRKAANASNGANTNIEFVPVIRDPKGNILFEKGINRVYLTDEQHFEQFNADYVFNNPSMYWDVDKYLNVWILNHNSWANTSQSNRYSRSLPFVFAKGKYDASAFPLPKSIAIKELQNQQEEDNWEKKPNYLENVGIVFHKSSDGFAQLYPAYVSQLSAFLGVIPNSSVNDTSVQFGSPKTWVDDYCDDTFAYNQYYAGTSQGGLASTVFGNSRIKYTVEINAAKNAGKPGYPWITYESVNTGEQSSDQSIITQDQAKRIEWTLNNAFARQMWKDSYAIAP